MISINKIEILEFNDQEESAPRPTLQISNHWNRKSLVYLEFQDTRVLVWADELIRAIQNAQNAHTF